MSSVAAPTITTTTADAPAVWHGLALQVAGLIDRRDERVAPTVAALESELGLPRSTSTVDDRWPVLARRFSRAHRAALRDGDPARITDLAVTAQRSLEVAATAGQLRARAA